MTLIQEHWHHVIVGNVVSLKNKTHQSIEYIIKTYDNVKFNNRKCLVKKIASQPWFDQSKHIVILDNQGMDC
jgi:hypothetical protein